MKLMSWNVNGLRAVMKKNFFEFLEESSPDILCLQETKMQEGQEEVSTSGYHQYWCSADRKGYSGTLILTKEEPVSVTTGMGIDEHDHEGRIVTCEFEDFYLVNVYVPNSKDGLARLDYRMDWEDAFRDYVKRLENDGLSAGAGAKSGSSAENVSGTKIGSGAGAKIGSGAESISELKSGSGGKPVVICGDMNVAHEEIDIKNPGPNRRNAGFTDEERGKMTELLNAGFVDTFRYLHPDAEEEYSWWSYRFKARERNAGWRIDYFLISEDLVPRLNEAGIRQDVFGSDHCPIVLELK